jgi:hypothetical protein
MGEPGVATPQCLVADPARPSHQCGGFGEREGHALVGADRPAEGFAVARIGERFIEPRAGAGQAHQADQGSGELEALHTAYEAFPLPAHETIAGDGKPVEVERRPPDRATAEIPEGGALHVGLFQVDVKGRDAARPLLGGAGEHDCRVSSHAQRDGGLLAGESPTGALSLGTHPQARRVGAVLGLGQAEARQDRAVGDRGKQRGALGLAARRTKHLGGKQRDEQEVGGVEVGGGHLLGGDPRGHCPRALPAVALLDGYPGEPERGHVGKRAGVELSALVVRAIAGSQALARKLPYRLAKLALILVEAEVHPSTSSSGVPGPQIVPGPPVPSPPALTPSATLSWSVRVRRAGPDPAPARR